MSAFSRATSPVTLAGFSSIPATLGGSARIWAERARRDPSNKVLSFGQLAGEDERVEGHVALHASTMQEGYDVRQLVERKIVGAGPRIEAPLEAEVNGVRAILDGRADAIPVTRGREQLDAGGRSAAIVYPWLQGTTHPTILPSGRSVLIGDVFKCCTRELDFNYPDRLENLSYGSKGIALIN